MNGDKLGVQRQEDDARKLCADRGWTVVEVFCDNDRSAYDRRKTRPGYAAMLEAVKAREINVIVAWHPDRLHRQTRELVPFIDVVTEYSVKVETVTAGHYDLSTPSGQMQAHMLGSVAEYESEHKSERIRRKMDANAAAGINHGGMRPYGWAADRTTLDPSEAAVVREAADRVLAGESVRGIARDLNAAGHRSATGRPWRDVTVRDMLLRPRNAGLRLHHGEVVGHGKWDADPARRQVPPGRGDTVQPGEANHSGEGWPRASAVSAGPLRRLRRAGRGGEVQALQRQVEADLPVPVNARRPRPGVRR